MLAVAISGSTAPLDLARSGTGMTFTTNLALGAAPLGQRLAVRLPGVEHGRRQHEHLPGGRRRHLAGPHSPSTWVSTRTQTLAVLGSNDDVTWTTLVGSATYTWNSSTGNTVSIALPSGASDRYAELSVFAAGG
jgi:hypothetical protein